MKGIAMKLHEPFVGLLMLVTGFAAFAHSDAKLAKMTAPNGGQLRSAGPWHLELVIGKGPAGDRLVVYVTDHTGATVPTDGSNGSVTILSRRTKAQLPLAAYGENRLKADAGFVIEPESEVVVSLRLGNRAEQAKFAPQTTQPQTTQPESRPVEDLHHQHHQH